jgi:hypothetical protein
MNVECGCKERVAALEKEVLRLGAEVARLNSVLEWHSWCEGSSWL